MYSLEDLTFQDQWKANIFVLIVARSVLSIAPTASQSGVPTREPTASPRVLTVEPTASGAPTGEPAASPTALPGGPIQVRLGDFYMSYASTRNEEPTADEYNQLVAVNKEYFAALYTTHFETNPEIEFVDIQLELRETRHGTNAGIPEPRFNIYMVRA